MIRTLRRLRAEPRPTSTFGRAGAAYLPWRLICLVFISVRASCRPQRLQIAEEIAPSPYQTFLSAAEPEAPPPEVTNPRYWSDYNRVFYHPRSLLPLEPRFKSQNSGGASGMSKWEEGGEAWASLKKVGRAVEFRQHVGRD